MSRKKVRIVHTPTGGKAVLFSDGGMMFQPSKGAKRSIEEKKRFIQQSSSGTTGQKMILRNHVAIATTLLDLLSSIQCKDHDE